MRTLNSFTFLTLNGFYKGIDQDTSWHRHGEEESQYSEDSLQSENILLFGRTTYEMMESFWPTLQAAQTFPTVAKGMNNAEKIVFSNSLTAATWENTTIISGDIATQVRQIKSTKGNDLTILGSGSIVTQLSDTNLIDSYQIMIDPVVIGHGNTIFNGLKHKLNLRLVDSRIFKSGVVLLTYKKLESH